MAMSLSFQSVSLLSPQSPQRVRTRRLVAGTEMGENSPEFSEIHFPPFPQPPPGVTIIPFKNYKEHGIHLTRNRSGQEIDGMGVPTVALPIQDEPDPVIEWPRHIYPSRSELQQGDRKQWWQYWEENDKRRPPFAFNPQQPRLDRLFTAVSSFRGSRRWPFEQDSKPGPKYFWDQFRIFIGASGYPPAWNRIDKPKYTKKGHLMSLDYSGDEDNASSNPQPDANIQVLKNPSLNEKNEKKQQDGPARPPYAYYNTKPVDLSSDEAVRELLELDKLKREERLIDFLDDPEKLTKAFLSSYSRGQSFWWSDENLDILPRLTCFFFKFLLRNRVFCEHAAERKFQSALKVAELAHKELPYTSFISKFVPDEFGNACREYWGSQKENRSAWSDDDDDEKDIHTRKEENKNIAVAGNTIVAHDDSVSFKSKITHITFDEEIDVGKDAIDTLSRVPPSPSIFTRVPVPEAFRTLLTSTNAFPVTHTPRLVEHSLRRIKHVLPPGAFASAHAKSHRSKSRNDAIGSIDAVEVDLENMLLKVVLVPWVNSGFYGHEKPEITKCYEPTQGAKGGLEEEHDPLEDEITVLFSVASKEMDVLRDAIGMGLAGTWVQLRPVGEDGRYSSSRRLSYWYLDHLDAVIPSYWTC